jgi:hypothetical protein
VASIIDAAMKKEEAERALAIIRQVVEHTRDDLVEQNWGLLWMLHAFTNLAAFVADGLVIEARGLPARWYLAPLAVVATVNVGLIVALSPRDRGARSFVEVQMNGIWLSFIGLTALAALAIDVWGLPPRAFFPVIAVGSATGFATMSVVFHRRFLLASAGFVGALFAGAYLGVHRWTLLGVVWWATLFPLGLSMHRARLARAGRPAAARIL